MHTLQSAGHTVSVVLPHTQRSWIGKAHIVGQTVRPTYFRPGPLRRDDSTGALSNTGVTSSRPLPAGRTDEEWILVDSTPASCVQIGLHHYFKERGPVELVISGPNYGRNSTAVFSLSSGTVGGALEAAVCGVRAIALSYAFFDRNHDPDVIAGASRMSVKVVEYLWANWGKDVHLYSVNVPLIQDVEKTKVLWTYMLQNKWTSGSCFQEMEVPDSEDEGPDEAEVEIRSAEEEEGRRGSMKFDEETATNGSKTEHVRYKHKHFKWAPRFKDVYQSVDESEPGNDGWAVKEGKVRYVLCSCRSSTRLLTRPQSVTPLRANFMHVDGHVGEIKL